MKDITYNPLGGATTSKSTSNISRKKNIIKKIRKSNSLLTPWSAMTAINQEADPERNIDLIYLQINL